ncbi:PREDICTED: mitogen-activated protein kinase kinase kinase 7 [Drosophila arizonae]|uniref:Mitogen-activated protein kinase kinase kinase 7 n=1 Tax=Drosophila arizonae TaxID=7263 RepID=A0ABM1NM06_DROAR|nr:PREDICTED: mitogen-activated protein kinase kinase kinase 7 [Drosophila arizonae]
MDANNYIDSIHFTKITNSIEIASGTYGIVLKGQYDNKTVALKQFKQYGDNRNVERALRNLRDVRHPNILTLIGDSSNGDSLYSIMEYADGGSLKDFLHNPPLIEYTFNHVVNWALQYFSAVAYLHSRQPPLLHGDLKPSNMLLMDHRRVLKISDFGSVRAEATTNTNQRTNVPYIAPETFKGVKSAQPSEVYTCSIILWEMMSRKQVYENIDSSLHIMRECLNGMRPNLEDIKMVYPEELKKLIVDSWEADPSKRPKINRFVDFFSKYFEQNNIIAADLSI